MKKSTKPSRGRKMCPGCQQYVGVRTIECDCGHKFGKAKKPRNEPEKREDLSDYAKILPLLSGKNVRVIYASTYDGKLRRSDKSSVYDFIYDAIQYEASRGGILSHSAAKLLLRHQLGGSSSDYLEAVNYVNEIYEEIKCDTSSLTETNNETVMSA